MVPDGSRAKLELLSEGDGTQFPNLFVPAQDEVIKDALPYVLLANSLKLIQEGRNPKTGGAELLVVAKDENGFDTEPIYLGKTLGDCVKNLDLADADRLKSYVKNLLGNGQNLLDSTRSQLQESVVAAVDAIKVECGNNVQDQLYRRFLEGGKQAVSMLKVGS
jgi:hypothetical protein